MAHDHQWADAKAVLSPDGPRRHWLGRARGWSKTSDAAGLTLAAMVADLPAGSTAYAAAGDRDQARLLLDALRGFVTRTPELAGVVDIGLYKAVAPRSGVTLEVLAADGGGSYGLRPAWLITDELCQWPETPNALQMWEALTTALPKVAGSRLLVTTTAGSPSHWSAKVHSAGVEDELWRVSDVDGPAPWMDPVEVEAERRRLPEASFLRLFMNQWVEADDRLARPEDVDAAAVLDGPLDPAPGLHYVVTLDVGLTNDRTVCVVAHAAPVVAADGRHTRQVVVDRIAVWQGRRDSPVDLGAVESWIAQAAKDYHASVVADPYQAAQLVQRLRAAGIQAKPWAFTAQSVGRLGAGLHVLLRERLLWIPKDEQLINELRRVRLRESSPGVFRLDHASGEHDDMAVCIALAAHVLLERSSAKAKSQSVAGLRLDGSFGRPGPRLPDPLGVQWVGPRRGR